MIQQTLDTKVIETLRELPDLIPVLRNNYEDWSFRTFDRQQYFCKNYLSPNRREFYKVLLITAGTGIFTLGLNTYYIEEPTILFIHPNEIISWKNLSPDMAGGHFCLFRRKFIDTHPQFKAAMDKLGLFTDKSKSVIRVTQTEALEKYFLLMKQEELTGGELGEDAIQAYLQLLMVESMRIAQFPKPDVVTDEFRHVHAFFHLLEQETANINYTTPIRIKTAKEFAASLAMHPNYLNALLKKHTGQNVSSHIRNRLLDESKALLLQTDWSLQDIGYSIGFAEQPNFNLFFKKNTGVTPAEFRRSYHL